MYLEHENASGMGTGEWSMYLGEASTTSYILARLGDKVTTTKAFVWLFSRKLHFYTEACIKNGEKELKPWKRWKQSHLLQREDNSTPNICHTKGPSLPRVLGVLLVSVNRLLSSARVGDN